MKILKEINKHLRTLNVPVTIEHLISTPSRFLIIDVVGMSEVDKLKKLSIAIQSYGKDLADTIKLNDEVIERMSDFVKNENVSSVKLDSSYNFTDLELKRNRYQAVFDIYHY